ncbi:MAG: hypothetical protein CM1200mP40_21000 [Gammaproteobacteria bacterium]|nr:MAG: hypothetical protein CM1200mP40_21000 [Gammaproteobacteria bacterium]
MLNAPGLIPKQVKQNLHPEKQTTTNVNWKIEDRFHCGGYAKINSELESFLSSWKTDSEIPIEAVYTGKLFWGLRSLIEQGAIEKGSEVIAIHSGGKLSGCYLEHSYVGCCKIYIFLEMV